MVRSPVVSSVLLSLMSFSVAACDLSATEAGWLDKSPASALCVSVAVGPCYRCLTHSCVPPHCRRHFAAVSPKSAKRQRLAASRPQHTLITAAKHPPALATLAPIEHLTSPLLTAIAPFLTLREKLLQLTRLSHAFPVLTPACFRRDDINLNTTYVKAIAASKRHQYLFSQLQSLSYVYQPPQHTVDGEQQVDDKKDGERVKEGEQQLQPSSAYQQFVHLIMPLSSSAATSVFPALLSLTVVADPHFTQSTCNELFAALPHLSHLSTLHFATHDKDTGERVTSVALSELRHCPALRQLTLDNHAIDHRTFVLLCTLPLAHLDLSGVKLIRSLSSDVTSPAMAARLLDSTAQRYGSSWRSVLLPKAKQEADEQVIDAVLNAYFQHVDAPATMDVERASSCHSATPAVLEYLNCNSQISSSVYSSLASLTSLTTLDLDGVRVNADTLEVSPFFTPSLAPRLPQLVHFISPRNYREVADDDKDKQLQRVNQFYISFLVAYSSQLRTMRLKVPDTCLCIDIVNAVFKCHQLRKLTLSLYSYAYGEEETVELPEQPVTPAVPLLQLHFLKLHGLPLTDVGLAALLRACPNVENLKLAKSDMLTMDGLEAVGLSCPLLRRLTLKSCEFILAGSGRESLNLQCAPMGEGSGYVMADGIVRRIFPSLTILSIVNYAQGGGGVDEYSPLDYSPSALRLLVSLLCCSPLAYLRLHIDLTTAELLIFSPLTHLYFLRASNTLPDPLHRFFTDRLDGVEVLMPSVVAQRLLNDERVSEEEMRRSWLAKARVAESPSLFVSEAVFDGLTGREAFFRALAMDYAESCDGEEYAGTDCEEQGYEDCC